MQQRFSDGVLQIDGPGFNASHIPPFSPTNRVLISIKDSEAGQGFSVTRIFVSDYGLIAYYPFNGTMYDESGNDNHGTSVGATLTSDRFGNPYKASYFNGTDAYITIPNSETLSSPRNALTVSLWFQSEVPSTIHHPFLTKSNSAGYDIQYSLNYCNCTGGDLVDLNLNGVSRNLLMSFPIYQWNHLVVSWDGSTIRYFKNGIQVGIVSNSDTLIPTNLPLEIGRNTPGDTEYFKGAIDDIRIHNRALTLTEVQELYHEDGWPIIPVIGMVAYYPFAGNANDESGNENHATNIVGAQLTADRFGNPNSAYHFDGNDMIKGTIGSSLDLDSLTICTWVRVTGAGGHNPRIFAIGPPEFQGENYSLIMHNPSTRGAFYSNDLSPNELRGNGLLDNGWHFHVATIRPNQVSLYYDGVYDTTLAVTGSLNAIAGNLVKFGDSDNGLDHLVGDIDDSRIYNYILTQQQIDSLFRLNGWPLQQTTWQSTIIAFDACGDTLRPVFGQAPLATNCIDSIYGEAELPPTPPSGAFDVRFHLPCSTDVYSLKDFRNDSLSELRWKLRLQACSPPITLMWDTTGFPDGCMYIRDAFGGIVVNVNMRTQTELVVPPAITELWIERSESVCRTITTHAGWNMLSLPVHVSQDYYLNVFPDATSHPFRFTPSGYVLDDTLKPGIGYWVKFDGNHMYNVCGCTDVVKSISVSAGWNMIGPFEDTVLVSGITSIPGGIIISPFYHYFPPYQTVDTLFPGTGYWVKVSEAGTLFLNAGDTYPSARSTDNWTMEAPPSPPGGHQSETGIPVVFSLAQNHPNPFNPSTTIQYALPVSGVVTLTIYDQLGREVKAVVNEMQEAGYKTVMWNSTNNAGEHVASGVYFYRLQAGEFVQTKKLLLLR